MFKGHKENGSGTKAVSWNPSRDKSISFHAKGILYYLLLKPENWSCKLFDIESNGTDSDHMIRKGIKELVLAGYMKRIHIKDGDKFKGSYYEFADKPLYI